MIESTYQRPGVEQPRSCTVVETLGICADSEGAREEMLHILVRPLALGIHLTVPASQVGLSPADWVELHKATGHEASITQIAAPGYGQGSYCWACSTYGPSTGGMLSLEDVR